MHWGLTYISTQRDLIDVNSNYIMNQSNKHYILHLKGYLFCLRHQRKLLHIYHKIHFIKTHFESYFSFCTNGSTFKVTFGHTWAAIFTCLVLFTTFICVSTPIYRARTTYSVLTWLLSIQNTNVVRPFTRDLLGTISRNTHTIFNITQ